MHVHGKTLAVASGLVLWCASAKAQTPVKVGQIAPDFQARSISGKPLQLVSFRGKVVLLDFWTTT